VLHLMYAWSNRIEHAVVAWTPPLTGLCPRLGGRRGGGRGGVGGAAAGGTGPVKQVRYRGDLTRPCAVADTSAGLHVDRAWRVRDRRRGLQRTGWRRDGGGRDGLGTGDPRGHRRTRRAGAGRGRPTGPVCRRRPEPSAATAHDPALVRNDPGRTGAAGSRSRPGDVGDPPSGSRSPDR
jgi:hypothetical protein